MFKFFQYLLKTSFFLFLLGFQSTQFWADKATLIGAVVNIPVLEVEQQFYSIDLAIIPGTDPIEFGLTRAEALSSGRASDASVYADGILTVPTLDYNGASYGLQLELSNTDPVELKLVGISENSTIATRGSYAYDEGAFVQISNQEWVHNTTDGNSSYSESGRGDQLIVLEGVDEEIMIDLKSSEIIFNGSSASITKSIIEDSSSSASSSIFKVSRLSFSEGAFIQLGNSQWTGIIGDVASPFTEQFRDEDSIHLTSDTDGSAIEIDNSSSEIVHVVAGQRTVVGNNFTTNPDPITGFVMREATTAFSYFVNTEPLVWVEYINSEIINTYTETRRDFSSTYLENDERDFSLLINSIGPNAGYISPETGEIEYTRDLAEDVTGPRIPSSPAAPSVVTGGSESSLQVSWVATFGADTFVVYRCSDEAEPSCEEVAQVVASVDTQFTDSDVSEGITYFYRVAACNSAGCSVLSVATAGSTEASPENSTPDFLVASIEFKDGVVPGVGLDEGLIQILARNTGEKQDSYFDWNFYVDDELYETGRTTMADADLGALLVGGESYAIVISYFFGDEDFHSFRFEADTNKEIDEIDETNNSLRVFLQGIPGVGSAPSGPPDAVVESDWPANLPDSPNNVAATDGLRETGINVSWSKTSLTDFYDIYQCISELELDCTIINRTASADILSFEDATTLPNEVLLYRVKACNLRGCSDFSEADTGYRSGGVPAIPAAITASDDISDNFVQVRWDASNYASAYDVYRCESESTDSCVKALANVAGNNAQVTTGTLGTVYYYRVQACNNLGCSGFSIADSGSKLDSSVVLSEYRELESGVVNANADEFIELDEAYKNKGWRLKDFDIAVSGDEILHSAIWEEGEGDWYITTELSDFEVQNIDFETNKGMRLIDIEVVVIDGLRVYAGVWHPKGSFAGSIYNFMYTSGNFDEVITEAKNAKYYLEDLEVTFDDGNFFYSGVFTRGENLNFQINFEWESSGDINHFLGLHEDYILNGWTLIDLDARTEADSTVFGGVWHQFSDDNGTLIQNATEASSFSGPDSDIDEIITYSSALSEIGYELVDIEVDYSGDLAAYTIISYPDYGYEFVGNPILGEASPDSRSNLPILPQLESMEQWTAVNGDTYNGPFGQFGTVSGHIQGVARATLDGLDGEPGNGYLLSTSFAAGNRFKDYLVYWDPITEESYVHRFKHAEGYLGGVSSTEPFLGVSIAVVGVAHGGDLLTAPGAVAPQMEFFQTWRGNDGKPVLIKRQDLQPAERCTGGLAEFASIVYHEALERYILMSCGHIWQTKQQGRAVLFGATAERRALGPTLTAEQSVWEQVFTLKDELNPKSDFPSTGSTAAVYDVETNSVFSFSFANQGAFEWVLVNQFSINPDPASSSRITIELLDQTVYLIPEFNTIGTGPSSRWGASAFRESDGRLSLVYTKKHFPQGAGVSPLGDWSSWRPTTLTSGSAQ